MTVKLYGFKDKMFEDIATLGENNCTLADRFCALLLALSPILQFYKGLYRNAGFTVLLLVSPLIILRFLVALKNGSYDKKCMGAIVPMILFQIFKMFDHTVSINKMIYCFFFVLLFMAISAGSINVKLFVKYAAAISGIAAILLAVQYFCYYILGFHLKLAPTSLFLPESSGWIPGVKTGLVGVRGIRNGFYRPSAFFMEPSHLFMYTFPVLCIMLLSPGINRWRRRVSLWMTLGMVLSTSGMGVAVAIGLWIVYFALYYNRNDDNNTAKLKNLLSAKNFVILVGLIALIAILYFSVPILSKTVNRFIMKSSTGGSLAIDGRTKLARMLVSGMSGKSLFVGVTENLNEVDFNMSGYYATLYKYGWIGIIFSYWYYVQYVFRLKGSGFWISVIILVVSFFSAHTHGTFYMMYYIIVLMNALYMKNREMLDKDTDFIQSERVQMT